MPAPFTQPATKYVRPPRTRPRTAAPGALDAPVTLKSVRVRADPRPGPRTRQRAQAADPPTRRPLSLVPVSIALPPRRRNSSTPSARCSRRGARTRRIPAVPGFQWLTSRDHNFAAPPLAVSTFSHPRRPIMLTKPWRGGFRTLVLHLARSQLPAGCYRRWPSPGGDSFHLPRSGKAHAACRPKSALDHPRARSDTRAPQGEGRTGPSARPRTRELTDGAETRLATTGAPPRRPGRWTWVPRVIKGEAVLVRRWAARRGNGPRANPSAPCPRRATAGRLPPGAPSCRLR